MALASPIKARDTLLASCDFGFFFGNFRPDGVVDYGGHHGLHEGPAKIGGQSIFQAVATRSQAQEALHVALVLPDAEGDLGQPAPLDPHVILNPARDPFAAALGICVISAREPHRDLHQIFT